MESLHQGATATSLWKPEQVMNSGIPLVDPWVRILLRSFPIRHAAWRVCKNSNEINDEFIRKQRTNLVIESFSSRLERDLDIAITKAEFIEVSTIISWVVSAILTSAYQQNHYQHGCMGRFDYHECYPHSSLNFCLWQRVKRLQLIWRWRKRTLTRKPCQYTKSVAVVTRRFPVENNW